MLTNEQQAFYNENGYILLKGLLSKWEAASFRAECHNLAERLSAHKNIESTWGSARESIAGAKDSKLLHCHDVQFYAAAFSRLLIDERFTAIASDLIKSPNVQLHHTKMFIKPPEKGSPFPLHQDYPYFPHQRQSMTAAIFHFDDAPLEKGCVRVIPGSYKDGPLPHIETGSWHLSPEKYPLELATPCPAEAGDVLFFNYMTVHGSGLNVSNEARTTLLVQFRDPTDLPTTKSHQSRGQGMILRGVDPLDNFV